MFSTFGYLSCIKILLIYTYIYTSYCSVVYIIDRNTTGVVAVCSVVLVHLKISITYKFININVSKRHFNFSIIYIYCQH